MGTSTLAAQILMLLALSSNGCTFYDWAWPPGTTIRIEATEATQTTPEHFRYHVMLAASEWTRFLGDDCAFPYTFEPDGSHVITLVAAERWSHDDDFVGIAFEDHIDIRDAMPSDVRLLAIIQHEFGHAFGLDHAPRGSDTLMSPQTENHFPTADDVSRARDVLGCEALP